MRTLSLRKKNNASYVLQLTSMVDMFTIILVFLLKSYSTSAVQLSPSDGISLPTSLTANDPVEGLKISVSQKGIFVEDKPVFDGESNLPWYSQTDKKDKNFLVPLFEELDRNFKKVEEITKKNDTIKFDGRVVIQVDKTVAYRDLKKVMYTASVAGYADFRLVTIDGK